MNRKAASLAALLLLASCGRDSGRPAQDAQAHGLAVGQVWNYRTRDVDQGSTLTICRLEELPNEEQLSSMREGLLPGLLTAAVSRESIAGGLRLRFDSQPGLLARAAAVIEAEHRCCRFLRFLLTVEPGDGPVWLEVTGPAGTEDFLSSLLNNLEPPPAKSL